jgi:hypothetical protein
LPSRLLRSGGTASPRWSRSPSRPWASTPVTSFRSAPPTSVTGDFVSFLVVPPRRLVDAAGAGFSGRGSGIAAWAWA